MTEPFKNVFNEELIRTMGSGFLKAYPEFKIDGFISYTLDNLNELELKQRSMRITKAMENFLPNDFSKTSVIILNSLEPENKNDKGFDDWSIMPMADYVGIHGLEYFDLSMNLFKELTKRFSAEFGIRYFLLKEPEKTLEILKTWLDDKNFHVRRLISEGTRPRLPWGMGLPVFVKNPELILPLLEELKDDNEEYVRRSVANSLNDIAKDNPDMVAGIAKKWLKDANKTRKKLVRHACRTLIKQGHQGVLQAFGYNEPNIDLLELNIFTPNVEFGKALEFELSINSNSIEEQPLIIDYIIHHKKANGSTSPKVFKWKNIVLKSQKNMMAIRKHKMKKITTRTYYSGTHELEIIINGISKARMNFELINV